MYMCLEINLIVASCVLVLSTPFLGTALGSRKLLYFPAWRPSWKWVIIAMVLAFRYTTPGLSLGRACPQLFLWPPCTHAVF